MQTIIHHIVCRINDLESELDSLTTVIKQTVAQVQAQRMKQKTADTVGTTQHVCLDKTTHYRTYSATNCCNEVSETGKKLRKEARYVCA